MSKDNQEGGSAEEDDEVVTVRLAAVGPGVQRIEFLATSTGAGAAAVVRGARQRREPPVLAYRPCVPETSAAATLHRSARVGETAVVTYRWGQACNGATKAALEFAKLGYPVKEMLGGCDGWVAAGLPTA